MPIRLVVLWTNKISSRYFGHSSYPNGLMHGVLLTVDGKLISDLLDLLGNGFSTTTGPSARVEA